MSNEIKESDATQKSLSEWHGFKREDFLLSGRECLLVFPKKEVGQKHWIWRTEFFGHEPQADIALLNDGFYVAYMDVQNMYGGPAAIDLMDGFYGFLRERFQLAPKTVLEGFSRGGLFALNWAIRNPQCVACLYLDAPVTDFKSWPGGKGKAQGSTEDWERLKQVYDLTEEQAIAYKLNPIDNLQPLADAGVPILGVYGVADVDLPPEENIELLAKRYQAMGGPITLIPKPGIGHHPHSLPDPTPIVDFVLDHR